jgi:aryl-alcohol dehydrogenase-like predicted oxidoreductase
MKENHVSRLVIGTAQFGMSYGITNNFGKVTRFEVNNIFEIARINKINTIDTAISYGNSQEVIGSFNLKEFNIITKVSNNMSSYDHIKSDIINSLKEMKIKKLYGVMLHDPDLLISNPMRENIFSALSDLKSEGLTDKIGISIYSPEQIDNINDNFKIDIVQAPFNILDKRMHSSGCFKRLKDLGIEIHVRSIFLQGLLLMSKDKIPSYFKKWYEIFNYWNEWLELNNQNHLDTCVQFVKSIPEIDKIVVGIESSDQLKEIINSFSTINTHNFPDINCDDLRLINPSKWNTKK